MKLDPVYSMLWVLWAVFFFIVEGSALLKDSPGKGTLTSNIRKLLSLGSKTKWTGRIIAAVFLAWLCWHFMYPVPTN